MLNRLNNKERAHLATVKELPCSVCDQPGPSEAYHIEQRQQYTAERPRMPTEQLPGGVDVDIYVQAAGAELERREGYEIQLRAALANCKRPLKTAS